MLGGTELWMSATIPTGMDDFSSDSEILALADTRTGRAFMLIARVSGTFD